MWKKAALTLTAVVTLAACSGNQEVTSKEDAKKSSDARKEEQVKQKRKGPPRDSKLPVQPEGQPGLPKAARKTGHFYQEGVGEIQIEGVGFTNENGLDGETNSFKEVKMGPMRLRIKQLIVINIKIEDGAGLPISSNADRIKVIIVSMSVSNSDVENVVYFNPDQATIVTNTGEHIEAELLAGSGYIGRYYSSHEDNKGDVCWILKDPDKKIENLKLKISTPLDRNFYKLSNDKQIKFEILPYKEAMERDDFY